MQAVQTEPSGAYVTFKQEEKQRIEDAGQSLIRGEPGAADSLISAAEPLCTIVTGQFVKRFKRLWDRRDEFRGVAKELLVKAVGKIDSKLKDGTQSQIKSFRAYLGASIRHGLVRYSKQSDRAARDERAKEFDIQDSGFDWIELMSLSNVEKEVYQSRMQGKKWDDVAASVNKTVRHAARIFKRVQSRLNPTAQLSTAT